MRDETIKVLWIATLIVILEGFALYMGVNGTVLALVVGALAGLGGYELNSLIRAFRGEREKPDD